MKRSFFVFLLICGMSFSLLAEPKLLTILFTNDSHGMAWAFDAPDSPKTGGLAARKTLIDQIRGEVQLSNGDLVLLSSGNVTMGDPRSNACENLPMILGMNLIGYDGMLIGSHEFDFGMKAFENMTKEARFPFMSANLFFKNGKQVGTTSIQKQLINGVKVAFVGITTPELEKISNAGVDGLVKVQDPIEAARKAVSDLKAKGYFVVVLSNLGYSDQDISADGYPSDRKLAKEVPGIDLIIGGRTKIQMSDPVIVNDVPIVQTEGLGKWVGRYDFFFEGDKLIQKNYKLYPVNIKEKIVRSNGSVVYENRGKDLVENEAMLKMLNDLNCEFSTQVIGEFAGPLYGERTVLRSRQTELGVFVSNVMKERAKTDIAFTNGGAIRQGLSQGIVNEMDIYSVFPFEDTIVTGSLTGAQLMEVIATSLKNTGAGGYLHFSGVTFSVSDGKASSVKVNGEPLDMNKTYTFAVNSFVAGGGDGFDIMKNLTLTDTKISVPAAAIELIKRDKYIELPDLSAGK